MTYDGEQIVLSPEQIYAMLLGKINSIVKEANGGLVGIADAVITIPGWFTDRQRRAILVGLLTIEKKYGIRGGN